MGEYKPDRATPDQSARNTSSGMPAGLFAALGQFQATPRGTPNFTAKSSATAIKAGGRADAAPECAVTRRSMLTASAAAVNPRPMARGVRGTTRSLGSGVLASRGERKASAQPGLARDDG